VEAPAGQSKTTAEIDATVPKALNDIVMSALEIEPEKRLSSAREMAQQLEIWLGPSRELNDFLPAPGAPLTGSGRQEPRGVARGGASCISSVGPSKPAPAHAPVSVWCRLRQHHSDSVFDETLEPPLSVALEGASFISSYNRGRQENCRAVDRHRLENRRHGS